VQFEFVKPGKGQSLYKCRMKNMITGAQVDRTYRSGEKFDEADHGTGDGVSLQRRRELLFHEYRDL
jgi:translation elongation factor P/translation initiation factor 5A